MAAALPVVGSVVGGLISAQGAKSAAKTQAAGQQAAINAQLQMFNKTQANLQPYMQTGGYANTALAQLMGLGPNGGGYDQGAYQNAMNQYNASHPNTGTQTGTGGQLIADAYGQSGQRGGLRNIQFLDSNGVLHGITSDQLEERAHAAGYEGNSFIHQMNQLKAGTSIPNWLLGGSNSSSAGGNSGSSSGGSTDPNAPQLENFPSAGGGPLNSPLLKPIQMDQATLEKTPGYQFNLKQGLKSVQNSAAARGLGGSGAALKGAAEYATGLADNTYQQQFSNALTNQQNQYNRLFDVTNLGANAAAGLGGIGQKTGENLAQTYASGSSAQAGSQIAGANAIGSGISSAANQAGGLYGSGNALLGNNQGGTSGYGWNSYDPSAAAAGFPWSDERLKKDIIPIGYENGHTIYEFSYLWSPQRYVGVMAQDLISKIPEAVKKIGEYFAVDYAKIGVQFRSV